MSRPQAFNRLICRSRGYRSAFTGARSRSTAARAVIPDTLEEAGPSSSPAPPNLSYRDKGKQRVRYDPQAAVASQDKLAYFTGLGEESESIAWGEGEEGEAIPGLDVGRAVECRR